jgi:hypothetical protein
MKFMLIIIENVIEYKEIPMTTKIAQGQQFIIISSRL